MRRTRLLPARRGVAAPVSAQCLAGVSSGGEAVVASPTAPVVVTGLPPQSGVAMHTRQRADIAD
jgi:hypothetical protein